MTVNWTGLVLAVTVWLIAVVLAWPAGRPGVALVVLGLYVAWLSVLGVADWRHGDARRS